MSSILGLCNHYYHIRRSGYSAVGEGGGVPNNCFYGREKPGPKILGLQFRSQDTVLCRRRCKTNKGNVQGNGKQSQLFTYVRF